MNSDLNSRAYHSDIEKVTHILTTKADSEQVSNLMSETREELGSRIDSVKMQFHKGI